MADTKRTRRSSSEVFEEKINKLNQAKKFHQDQIKKIDKEIAELTERHNNPTRRTRLTTEGLIKKLSSNPDLLTKIFTEAAGDQDKLKELLIQAYKDNPQE